MFIVGLFSWWYGAGWMRCISVVRGGLASIYDYFSLDLLLRSQRRKQVEPLEYEAGVAQAKILQGPRVEA